jgi:type I restriction enzyme, S subunit
LLFPNSNLPPSWKLKKIKDIANLVKDQVKPKDFQSEPYVGLQHIGKDTLSLVSIGKSEDTISNKYRFNRDTILFGKLRPYFRKVLRPKFSGLCSTDIWVIETIGDTDLDYLFYLFASNEFVDVATSASTGTRMPRASWSYMSQQEMYIPPILEQKNISAILRSLDNKNEVNSSINKTIETLGETLFKKWFIDFEFPDDNGKPYRSSGGKMKDTSIGEIPEKWTIVDNISELCSKINYGYTQSASKDQIGPKFLRVTDINKNDWINWTEVPYCQIDGKKLPKYLLTKGDIVIARMADPGKVALMESDIEAVFASYLIRIKPKDIRYSYYLYYFMKSSMYQNYILGAASGSVQRNLNAKGLTTGLCIIEPASETIDTFNSLVDSLRGRINGNILESEKLRQFRDVLLPRLMSGEIRVQMEGV